MKQRSRVRRCLSLTVTGSVATLLLLPLATNAQKLGPLDPDADVQATLYKSPLNDFQAFDPDEPIRSWVDANKRVGEIGGWRAYLRQANPLPRTASPAPKLAPAAPATSPTPPPTTKRITNETFSKLDKPTPTVEPSVEKAIPTVHTASVAQENPIPGAELAEGGNGSQKREIVAPVPSAPDRFARGDCPRLLTGLKIPVTPRSVEPPENVKRLLLKLKRCFTARKYIIGGHTDGRGPGTDNLVLSQARADAVRNFLLGNGVDSNRISAKGYGESRPVDTNRTKRGRASNRRIDFSIDRRDN